MKNLKTLNFSVLALCCFLFIQCTTDPIAGPAGEDGLDGVDGVDGVNSTTECAQCHNVTTSEAVHASFAFSSHYENGTYVRGSSASCARCHSGNGFVDYISQGAMNDYTPSQAVLDHPEKITCTTCHDMHTTFDFEGEGYDYALRTLKGVDLMTDPSYTLDFNGTSNICANCHQPRSLPPADNGLGLYEITSTRFGPHHGPQATFLEGIQGGEIAGTVEYPAPGSATHRTGSSCTNCHMGESGDQIQGNHTWFPTETACIECHTGGAPSEVAGLEEDMATLLALLETVGVVEVEIDEEGNVDVSPVRGTYKIAEAEAAWNYILLMEDKSMGAHNPKYAKALIKNSIEALSAN